MNILENDINFFAEYFPKSDFFFVDWYSEFLLEFLLEFQCSY